MGAPGPGRYALRAERIGYRTTTTDAFDLAAGEVRTVPLAAAAQAVALEEIRVSGGDDDGRRCSLLPQAGREAAALWEEARKALNAAAWADQRGLFTFERVQYERDLNPRSLKVVAERSSRERTRGPRAFESVPAEKLARGGFVQAEADGTVYYAPDAQVLLSDPFLEAHCFRVRRAPGGASPLVGLTFEPVPGRTLPEIRGTLWLDRATAELRFLEYSYVNLRLGVPTDRLGGRVEFQRLPSGAWVVRRWWLRTPRLGVVAAAGGSGPASLVGGGRTVLIGLLEHGGEATPLPAGARP